MEAGELSDEFDPSAVAEFLLALYNGLGVTVALAGEDFQPSRAYELAQLALTLFGKQPPGE